MTTAPTLDGLLADPARAANLTHEERAAVLRRLAALLVVLSVEPITEYATNGNGELLTVPEVAALMKQDRSWVWRRARRVDWRAFTRRPSRKVLLVERAGLEAWLATKGGAR